MNFAEVVAMVLAVLSPAIPFGFAFLWWLIRSTYFKNSCPVCKVRALEGFQPNFVLRNPGTTDRYRRIQISFYRCSHCHALFRKLGEEWTFMTTEEWEHEVDGKWLKPEKTHPPRSEHIQRDYEEHQIQYVQRFYPHLLTSVERAALWATPIWGIEESEAWRGELRFTGFVWPHTAKRARQELINGRKSFVRHTIARLLSAHAGEITANACPRCHRLPATPQAHLCIWCGETWRPSRHCNSDI